MAGAVANSGAWVVCRPGCTQCCMGSFEISVLDARRLRRGLAELEVRDAPRAKAVRERARAYPDNESDDAPCPALDPVSGCCDLYEWRPITCRTFGPAIRIGKDAVAACELCYEGASEEEIGRCAVRLETDEEEAALIEALGGTEPAVVARALLEAER